jgi:hypothetical protein
MEKTPSEKKPLVPRNFLDVEGKIIYSEGDQAWNLIRLRKEILNEFHQLKEKSSKFSYKILYFRNFEEFQAEFKKIKKGEVLPMLVWFYRE